MYVDDSTVGDKSMRPTMRPEGLLEYVALWGNLGPIPVAEAMFGMGTARVIMAGCRLGLYAALADGAQTPEEAAARCDLDAAGTRHLLECLGALGHVRRNGAHYAITPRARRWLDPASPTYIGAFLEFNYDQWEWWSNLEEVVRTGCGYEIHAFDEDDPRWRRYIMAMFQL